MARFKLLAGTHDVGSGESRTTYRFDDPENNIVESDKPLDKLFKNKFERLNGKTEEPRDNDNTLNESGRQGDDPEHLKQKAKAAVARKPRFESEDESPKPKKVKPRDPGYDEDNEEEVNTAAAKAKGRTPVADEDDEAAEVAGDDVTEEFEGAGDAGFTVHKDAKAKVFRLAKDGKQVGDDLRNKSEAKKALKAELAKAAEDDEDADEDAE